MDGFQLKKLWYENLGGEPFFLRNFYYTAEYLDEPFSDMTLQVICLLLGDMNACRNYCHENSGIEAKAQIGEEEYRIMVRFQDGIAKFYVEDAREEDCTLWYFQKVVRNWEEQIDICLFTPGVYPVRLPLSAESCQENREYRDRFISAFQPQRLRPEKNYWLQLENDGRFTVRLGLQGEEITWLSETENQIYHYLCFLHSLRFRDGMVCDSDENTLKFPILIRDFLNRLDESVRPTPLLQQADSLGRQVLIFS